jgi:hypothetical protein
MEAYRPFRLFLFIYDMFRLVLVVGLLQAFVRSREETGAEIFPYLVYAAPNALFPMMALFLWVNLETYRAYLPLYMGGKAVTLAALAGWAVFSVNRRFVLFLADAPFLLIGLVLFLILLDLGTILGVFRLSRVLQNGASRNGESGGL